jgi:hypothetical protein
MTGSIHPGRVGEFTLPGPRQISLRKVSVRKVGTTIRNPSTGQMVPGADPRAVQAQGGDRRLTAGRQTIDRNDLREETAGVVLVSAILSRTVLQQCGKFAGRLAK